MSPEAKPGAIEKALSLDMPGSNSRFGSSRAMRLAIFVLSTGACIPRTLHPQDGRPPRSSAGFVPHGGVAQER